MDDYSTPDYKIDTIASQMSGTKVGNYRWFIAFLLFAATTINYIDRQIFGLLKPVLEKVFSWTDTDYARIVMAFTACYAIGQLVYGKIIDKIGTKLGYTGRISYSVKQVKKEKENIKICSIKTTEVKTANHLK